MKSCHGLLVVLLGLLAAPTLAQPGGWSFDFGPADEPAPQGYHKLTGKSLFDPAIGYGFEQPWGVAWSRPALREQHGVACDGLVARDHVGAAPKDNDVSFRIAAPAGVYQVTLWLGDPAPNEGRKGMCAALNGRVVLPAPGVGGWGQVVRRTLPAVVAGEGLVIRLFVRGESSSHRLSLLALTVEPARDDAQAAQLRQQWEQAAPVDAPQTQVRVGDQTYQEVGRRHEPALTEVPSPWRTAGFLTFTRSNPGELLDYSVPRAAELTTTLAGFTVAGLDEPFFFGVHARMNLTDVRVGVSPLLGPNPQRCIDPHDVTLFTLTTRPRTVTERPASAVQLTADLLDAYAPFDLSVGQTQGVYLRVRVPQDLPAGVYRGTVTLAPAQSPAQTLALQVLVLPLTLQPPANVSWHLFTDSVRWYELSPRDLRDEVEDMVRHGINSFSIGYPPLAGAFVEQDGRIVDADLGPAAMGLRHAAALGVQGRVHAGITPGIFWRFRGWSFNQQGAARHEFVPTSTDRALQITHADSDGRTGLSSVSGARLTPGQSVRLSVRYQLEGQLSARAQLQFMRSYKREPVSDNLGTLTLEPTGGQWRTLSVTSTRPDDAPWVRVTLEAQGGPGALQLDEVQLVGADPQHNLVVNGSFARDLTLPSDDQATWPQAFQEEFADALRGLGKAIERCGFAPVVEGTDEAGNNPASVNRELNEMVAGRRAGYPTWCNVSPAMAQRMGAALDEVCLYSNMLGNLASAHALRDSNHQQGRKIHYISSGCYLGQENDWMPNRHGVGLALWKSGYDGTGIWTYQRPNGDPFNDLDANMRDYCMVFPPRTPGGPPVPTLGWEGVREGWKDYLYVAALETAVQQARQRGQSEAAALGESVLAAVQAATPWFDELGSFDNAQANRLRWLAAWTTLRLTQPQFIQTVLDTPTSTASAPAAAPRLQLSFAPPTPIAPAAPAWLCPSTSQPPRVDGALDDPIWQQAARIADFVDYRQSAIPAAAATEVLLLHDREHLYLGFRCYEPALNQLKTAAAAHDGNVFADDSVELFLDTNHDQHSYWQLAFNAAGVQFDQRCVGAQDAGQNVFMVNYEQREVRDTAWNGVWTVRTSRQADRWEAEVAIPFATVGRASDLWGLHVARNRRAADPQTTTPRVIGFFHNPQRYAPLLLSGARVGQSRITAWAPAELRFGRDELTLPLQHASGLRAQTLVWNEPDQPLTLPGQVGAEAARFPLQLQEKSRQVGLLLTDAQGQPAHQLLFPAAIAPPLQLSAGNRVLLRDQPHGSYALSLPLSAAQRQVSRVTAILRDEQQREVERCSQAVQSTTAQLELDLTGWRGAGAELEVNLTADPHDMLAQRRERIMLVPRLDDVMARLSPSSTIESSHVD